MMMTTTTRTAAVLPTPAAAAAMLSGALEQPPVALPKGYVGPAWLPGTGRMIFWTGRVAIGLRHEAPPHAMLHTSSADWVQSLMLN
ncbi:MAG: hypothetical protein ABIX12_00030 [Rubrivivax sp.]